MDARKRPIRGVWFRNGSHDAQVKIEKVFVIFRPEFALFRYGAPNLVKPSALHSSLPTP